MPTVKVLSAGAVQSMVEALGPEFERASGDKLDLTFNTAGSPRERIVRRRGGRPGHRVGIDRSPSSRSSACSCPAAHGISAAPSPASSCRRARPCRTFPRRRRSSRRCSTPRRVAYTDPKAGGSGGIMFAGLLERLGIADAVNAKAVLGKRGVDVAHQDRRGARRDRHHLHQRSLAGARAQSGRPAAGRAAQRQHLYGGDPCGREEPGPPRPSSTRSPIRRPASAGPRPASSRRFRPARRHSEIVNVAPRFEDEQPDAERDQRRRANCHENIGHP